MSEAVLRLAKEIIELSFRFSILSHPTMDNSSMLLLQEYGGGIMVFASFTTLHMKLELKESNVLAWESDLK